MRRCGKSSTSDRIGIFAPDVSPQDAQVIRLMTHSLAQREQSNFRGLVNRASWVSANTASCGRPPHRGQERSLALAERSVAASSGNASCGALGKGPFKGTLLGVEYREIET